MASTIVGKSGRVYIQGEVLQRHREDHKLSVFKAESGGQAFVFKRVTRPFYDLSLRLAAEFAGSRRLRMHIDFNQEEGILFYPFFKSTVLALIQDDADIPVAERKKILRCTGEALQELHSKDWIHIDVKPDNILVNWTSDREGNKTISDVNLGDFDIAFKPEGGEPLHTPYAIGNAMWRSPEGQTGKGVTKASDIFSFGLVCIYALGGGELLLLNDYQELVSRGITPEQEVVTRHFSYFGPVPEGLFKHVDSEYWFERWGQDLGPEALDMISGMTNLDPTARTTIDQVLTHGWWQGAP
ncbi:kinase-like protein [Byssothecium circinans]|uniref:Kinase-like protein n=1 Tax=Byssothecium circinans TaxID=147558 RepID=A0A6A5TTM5_9PLEO|nr:kinase-like protein [Byssothecium circinans]